jgi:hypothetical protein
LQTISMRADVNHAKEWKVMMEKLEKIEVKRTV